MVYAPESNDVHILNPAARDLLSLMSGRAWTLDGLVAHLARGASAASPVEIRAGVLETLQALDRAGLVVPQAT